MLAGWLLHQADQARRYTGLALDAVGLGPIQTPSRIALHTPEITLKAYGDDIRHPPATPEQSPVLLLVPATIKQDYIWDLLPGISVVRRCNDAGFPVYLIQWPQPGSAQRNLGLADYAERSLLRCLDCIEQETGERQVVLMGHSLGGTLAAIFAALHSQRLRGLALLESPLHFGPGDLDRLLTWAPPAPLLTMRMDAVPGTLLNLAALAASPALFHLWRQADGWASLSDPRALRTHLLVERWSLDEMPLPQRLFVEVAEWLYREDRFFRGALQIAGRRADPRDVTMPILCVLHRNSSLVPAEAVLPFLDISGSRDKRVLWYDGDRGVALEHVGPLVGTNAHRQLWPQILRWASRISESGGSPASAA